MSCIHEWDGTNERAAKLHTASEWLYLSSANEMVVLYKGKGYLCLISNFSIHLYQAPLRVFHLSYFCWFI